MLRLTSRSWRGGVSEGRRMCSAAAVAGRRRPRGYWEDRGRRREFLDQLAKHCGVTAPADWKSVNRQTVALLGGRGLLKRYPGESLAHAVADAYPELEMDAADLRPNKEKGYWDSMENQRLFLDGVKEELGIRTANGWAKVVNKDIIRLGGGSLLSKHGNSLLRALQAAYPDQVWDEAACRPVKPSGYWEDWQTRRDFMDGLKEQFGIREVGDWRSVTSRDVIEAGGGTLLRKFRSSVFELLKDVYPDEEWKEIQTRPQVGKSYWADEEVRRSFFDDVLKQMGSTDHARITAAMVKEAGGAGLLQRYGRSVKDALLDTYPGLELDEMACSDRVARQHWEKEENRIAFMQQLADDRGFERPEDWQGLLQRDIEAAGGAGLLAYYEHNMVSLLADTVGRGDTDAWKAYTCRRYVPSSHWQDDGNVREFVHYLEQKLRIQQPADWARVSIRQIQRHNGHGLLQAMPLARALQLAYPDVVWADVDLDRRVKKAGQRLLLSQLLRLYPGIEFHEDYKHPSLQLTSDGRANLELDVYFPQLLLAFEFNGEHHYRDVGFFGPVEMYRRRDEEKMALCKEAGIRLIVIPHWWDETLESLAATIYEEVGAALPAEKPHHEEEVRKVLSSVREGKQTRIPRKLQADAVGPTALASKAGQATDIWDARRDPTGMLVTEKVDGVRAFWTADGELATRRGKKLFPPASWASAMPTGRELEGDLSAGRGHVGRVLQVVCEGPFWARADSNLSAEQLRAKEAAWAGVHFVACDEPAADGSPLSQRLERLRDLPATEVFTVADAVKCTGKVHLEELLERNMDSDGDGLLLRDPAHVYRYGRVQEAFRAKKLQTGMSCMVERSRTTRAFVVETASGAMQALRCSQAAYESPPTAGTVLELAHFGLWQRSGRFRHPFFVQERADLKWHAVRQSKG